MDRGRGGIDSVQGYALTGSDSVDVNIILYCHSNIQTLASLAAQ